MAPKKSKAGKKSSANKKSIAKLQQHQCQSNNQSKW